MLNNVKAIKYNFCIRKKLFNQVIIRTKQIHSNNFYLTANSSMGAKKVISDDSLCSTLKNSYDTEIVKILLNEPHLHLPIETVTHLTVLTSKGIISGKWLKLHSKWKSLSLRMTVEVEMASWCEISVIEVFSISFWVIFWLMIRGIWWFLLTIEVSATIVFEQW